MGDFIGKDEIRKKIIKDKFDKLKPIVLTMGKYVVLVDMDNKTYGLYYDYNFNGFGINPYYFMFNYIGLGHDEDDKVLKEYTDYIANLAYDKFKLKTPLLFDNTNPRNIIDYNTKVVKKLTTFLFDTWEKENR